MSYQNMPDVFISSFKGAKSNTDTWKNTVINHIWLSMKEPWRNQLNWAGDEALFFLEINYYFAADKDASFMTIVKLSKHMLIGLLLSMASLFHSIHVH